MSEANTTVHIHSNIVDTAIANREQQAAEPAFSFLANGDTVDRQLSFSELDQHARAIAAYLQQRGINKGDRVILLFCPGLDFVTALFGCFYAGVIAIPVNPPSSTGQSWKNFLSIINNAEASIILADTTKVNFLQRQYKISGDEATTAIVDIIEVDLSLANQYQKPEIDSDDVAMLQYTSGSTGLPKGVKVNHRNIMHNMRIINEQIYQGNSTIVSWLPVYHDMGLFGAVLQSTYVGGHCIMMPPSSFLMKPLRWLKAIHDFKASVSGGPNFAYELCAQAIDDAALEGIDLSHWKIAASGAEPVLAPTLRRFGKKFFKAGFNPAGFVPCYGLAECTLLVCANKKDNSRPPTSIAVSKQQLEQRVIELTDNAEDTKEFVSCGVPEPGDIVIVDTEALQLKAEGQVGEIWIRGDSVSSGYWNDEARTDEVFNKSVAGEGGYYRTGDLGFLWQDEIYISGRIKDLIIINGKNHYPGDIEHTLQASHDALMPDSGAVFSIDINGVEHVIVAQEVKQTALKTLDSEDVINTIKQAVTQHHEIQVHGVMLLKPGRVYKTSSGKIRRSACRDSYLANEFEYAAQWKSPVLLNFLEHKDIEVDTGPLENIEIHSSADVKTMLVNWIARRLSCAVDTIDTAAHHSSLGLDSIDMMSLFGEAEKALGLSINIEASSLWECESINDLAQALYDLSQQDSGDDSSPSESVEGFL